MGDYTVLYCCKTIDRQQNVVLELKTIFVRTKVKYVKYVNPNDTANIFQVYYYVLSKKNTNFSQWLERLQSQFSVKNLTN